MDNIEHAYLELAALFPIPSQPTIEDTLKIVFNNNPADARCILEAYWYLREAMQVQGKYL